jgi:hypothetical protein
MEIKCKQYKRYHENEVGINIINVTTEIKYKHCLVRVQCLRSVFEARKILLTNVRTYNISESIAFLFYNKKLTWGV